MIATLSRRSIAAREQWANPRSRARLLARQILAAERKRVDRLVADHLDLLRLASGHFSKRFPMIPREDLAQAAWFGLRRAAEMFDPTKGAQFHTYAFFWLRDAVQQEFYRTRSTIRVPRQARSAIPKTVSLDAPRGGDTAETFGALLVDEDGATPAELAHRADLRERVAEALATLIPRHAEVVALRFGINGAAYPHTAAEVARVLGVSRSRAGQIERRALGLLRTALAALAE